MLRYLLVFTHSLVLFVCSFFAGDNGITVTSNIPDKMNAGQEYQVELRVEKGNIGGFAKLQMDLPPGFIVKEADEKGSNYSFAEGVAKWVWAVLPQDQELVINLVLIAGPGIEGRQVINVRYSYVEENEKKVVDMDPAATFVYPAEAPAVVTHGITETPVETASVPAEAAGADKNGQVTISRTISPGNSINEFLITIAIHKGSTAGFSRYSDDLPSSVTASAVKTDGASFSVADGKVRFVWVSVPERENLEISYLISCRKTETLVLRGEYSYLEENQSKKVELAEESVTFEEIRQPKKKKDDKPVASVPEKTTPAVAATPKKEKKEPAGKAPAQQVRPQPRKIPAGIVYHVQVGAFSKKRMTTGKLSQRFKITEEMRSEMHEGYNKFMVGNHAEYRSARDHREVMINQHKIKSAFVVAYNNGKRITVQEALMITNQKWFK